MPSSNSSAARKESARADEDGFTILETIVVLAVCSIALFSLWALSMRIGTAFSQAGNSGAAALRATNLDRALRSFCARVEPPFWAKAPADSFEDGGATLRFFDGEPDSILKISAASAAGSEVKSVLFETDKAKLKIDGFDSFSAEPLLSADGRIAGLSAAFGCGGKEYECRALFSSWSLMGEVKE
jgi:type II secretory pathway pseudopilin PulG